MPRFEYRCTCDKCKNEMKPNDENDVSFNTNRLVYCESCYQNLIAHWEMWTRDNIRAGAEIHSDKGYSESTQEKYEEAKQLREDRREIKSSLGYSRVGMWGRK